MNSFFDEQIYEVYSSQITQNKAPRIFDIWTREEDLFRPKPSTIEHPEAICQEITHHFHHQDIRSNDYATIQDPTESLVIELSQASKGYLSNLRRKKEERQTLMILSNIAKKYQLSSDSQGTKATQTNLINVGQTTKNLLAFAKYSHLKFIRQNVGDDFFKHNQWFQKLEKRIGINLEDYDQIYKCHDLQAILEIFFKKRILYRELMLSRTIPMNRIFYLYFLDIFERNFRKRQFLGISETKIKIEKQKKIRKLNKKQKSNR